MRHPLSSKYRKMPVPTKEERDRNLRTLQLVQALHPEKYGHIPVRKRHKLLLLGMWANYMAGFTKDGELRYNDYYIDRKDWDHAAKVLEMGLI